MAAPPESSPLMGFWHSQKKGGTEKRKPAVRVVAADARTGMHTARSGVGKTASRCGAADKQVKNDMLQLLCYLYFQSGKRVAMYLENAQELAAVLNMFADEAEKQIGHPL